jgi:hypothetical protein
MNEFEVVSKPQITPKIKARADEKVVVPGIHMSI